MEELPRSKFSAVMAGLNRFDEKGFRRWSFGPGQGFSAPDKWWEDGLRTTPHEGLDLVAYIDGRGREHPLDPGTMVPSLYPGRTVTMSDDFLGRTLIIEHELRNVAGMALYGFYAHIRPDPYVLPKEPVRAGQVIGRLAPGSARCPCHLHLSTAWAPTTTDLTGFSWPKALDRPDLQFFDPRQLIDLEESYPDKAMLE